MATDAGVALEDNVTALIDRQAVVLVVDRAGYQRVIISSARGPYRRNKGRTHLSSMVKSVVLQSKPSVLWPAALPPLFEFGASPAATRGEDISPCTRLRTMKG